MKSDREFIDGIYEKAREYKEQEVTSLPTYKRNRHTAGGKAVRALSAAAALLLLCVAVDAIEGKVDTLSQNGQQEETGIAPLSVEAGPALYARGFTAAAAVEVTGTVLMVKEEENYFLLETPEKEILLIFCADGVLKKAAYTEGEKLCIWLYEGDTYGLSTGREEELLYPVYTME